MTKFILILAGLLAVLFEVSVFQEVPGIGYIIFWTAGLAGTVALLNRAERFKFERLWMFLPSLLFSFAVFVYDADVVRNFGALAALLTLAWAMAWNLLPKWSHHCLAYLLPRQSWNPVVLAEHARTGMKFESSPRKDAVVQVVRGVLMSVFLLGLFGVLLASADEVFQIALRDGLSHIGHLPLVLARELIWLTLFVGLFRIWLQHPELGPVKSTTVFQTTELTIALGSLNGLLYTFLGIQGRYLFGNSEWVEALGIEHAHYARRGFFELTLCIILILPLVLTAYRAAETHRASRLRYLGGGLVLAAFGLAASALKRMVLYIDVYGLSVERFYAAAGIFVAMSVLAWAGFACCRPRSLGWLLTRQKVTVIMLLALLSLINVDALVAQSQLSLAAITGRPLDSTYISQLSADALPVITRYETRIPLAEQTDLAHAKLRIAQNRGGTLPSLSYNISRDRASRYL